MLSQVTYIWMDGSTPVQKLRCKVRILQLDQHAVALEDFPDWSFDGSSTYQATGDSSDLILRPVSFFNDPLLKEGNYLLLCEVFNSNNTPHKSNTRALLRHFMENGGRAQQFWMGFEQEYTLFHGSRPLGWPEGGYPAPQGPFYCGVGADEIFGRSLVEEHAKACLEAGLMLFGINAEVMPGQWEFQIGYRGINSESADPLTVSDHLWLARWLLYRIGEKFNISASLDPKPVKGDWNGAGKHTNFSTEAMRDKKNGMKAIQMVIESLEKQHHAHIHCYGHRLEERLTGTHETASMHHFSSGVSNRQASIRIPISVAEQGYGYIEDRRPGANADPYVVSAKLLETICKIQPPV